MASPERVESIMHSDSKEEKIKILEWACKCCDSAILNTIISALDDSDIQIRGEAFSSLVLNENDISDILIQNLNSQSKNVRGFSLLVLANRNDKRAIPKMIEFTSDESPMVRSCAVGALGHLKVAEAILAIQKCMKDPNLEVRKSAIKAAIDVGDRTALEKIDEICKEDDPEIRNLLDYAKSKL
ncbi:MAG TPA: HEAT repeat domain-containing protein [Candidatus Nitrosotenuis sp.]|nr:HEAT repeat domain-containing protein [Candidatus Nitrosotenuis sp.]